MQRERYTVGITGSYGGLNLGDEAILESIVRQLRADLDVEIVVFSRDPADTKRRHAVDRAVDVRGTTREEVAEEIGRLDLLLFGGGGILFDAEARLFLREVDIAHGIGVPVMVYAVSAGPLDDPHSQERVRDQLDRATVVTVRDRNSRRVLEDIGVHREILVTADPALLLEPAPLSDEVLLREGLDGDGRIVGFSVREPGGAAPDLSPDLYHGLIANAADYVVARIDADVVFLPMERDALDLQHCHAVISRMAFPQRAYVLRGEYSAAEMLAVVGRMSMVIAMRLHVLIFAAIQGVPLVALPYASKVEGFLEAIGVESPKVKSVTPGRLIAHIDRCWDQREEIGAKVQEALPELLEKARETHRVAVRLLTEGMVPAHAPRRAPLH